MGTADRTLGLGVGVTPSDIGVPVRQAVRLWLTTVVDYRRDPLSFSPAHYLLFLLGPLPGNNR